MDIKATKVFLDDFLITIVKDKESQHYNPVISIIISEFKKAATQGLIVNSESLISSSENLLIEKLRFGKISFFSNPEIALKYPILHIHVVEKNSVTNKPSRITSNTSVIFGDYYIEKKRFIVIFSVEDSHFPNMTPSKVRVFLNTYERWEKKLQLAAKNGKI
ncbi:hypothetical protein PEC301296_11290 [Pectobacterium carotovorum subsp. carotovorum]|nr:hypothetical protein PEC301296_11290 [Pectobacterium carotovorum subsp. carotovorum]